MKAKRLITCTVLSLLLVLPNAAYAAEPEDTFDYAEAYEWALEAGFSEGFLNGISEESLKDVYYDNVGADELVIDEDVSVFTINDQNPGALTRAIKPSHMQFRASSSKVISGGKVKYVNVYFTGQWFDGRPVNRFTDGIEVNFESSVWTFKNNAGSFWGRVESVRNGTTGGTAIVNFTATKVDRANQGGLGWKAPLLHTSWGYTPTVRIGFKLYPKNTTMKDGTKNSSTIHGIYGHQQISLSVINFSLNGLSISMTGADETVSQGTTVRYG